MANSSKPAFPVPDSCGHETGLTKLEYAAIHIAAAWRASNATMPDGTCPDRPWNKDEIARQSVADARALFGELDKL